MCIQLQSGVIICGMSTQRFCACGRPATILCDWKVPTHKSGVCNRAVCSRHARKVAPDKYVCLPEHANAYELWKSRQTPQQGELFWEMT
jgi:hypothetical protein